MWARAAGLVLGLACAAGSATTAQELVVIVHRDRDASLDVHQVAQIYLKIRRHWPDGGRIIPVNRDARSRERERFSQLVFGESARHQALYWNRQYFQGVLPPATLASDEAVKRFVASEPLAIGYVDASATDASIRIVLRLPVSTASGRAPAMQ
jgi:ABC-type phosphate transport system substrate-binding protein